MIELRHVTKIYPGDTVALDDVDISIGKGEFVKGSLKVTLEGKAAVSQGAMTKHNDGNTIGMNSMAAQVKVDIA